MRKPKISVIMPAYKVEKYISTAIDSVISQSFQDWELIIVNDGSPDGSKDIADGYAEKDDRIRIVSKPNGGLSSARNYGLRFATGEYIHFFDSDDRILPHHYELYLAQLESKPDIVIAGYKVEFIDENNEVTNFINRDLPTGDGIEIKVEDPHDLIQFVCYAWNKLFRREFLLNNKLLYEEGLSRIEDAEFMSRAVSYNPDVRYIESGEYVYAQRPEITLSKGFDPSVIDILKRRIDLDKKLIAYFNKNITIKEADEMEKRLNASALRSAVNRLFDASSDKKVLQSNLKKIKSELLVKNYSLEGRSRVQKIFDISTYFALKHNLFFLIRTLQLARH